MLILKAFIKICLLSFPCLNGQDSFEKFSMAFNVHDSGSRLHEISLLPLLEIFKEHFNKHAGKS